MTKLRIIGDVHGQVEPGDVLGRAPRLSYSEIIAGADFSVQIGDMGDADTYDWLARNVDTDHHRFFPGNHDHYDRLPPHSLGDFGTIGLGGVEFFFVRGAASSDRANLLRLGERLGKRLWFEEEELTDDQMRVAEEQYLRTRPGIALSHDAPAEAARFAWQHAARFRVPDPEAVFQPSRTNAFLARLVACHQPRLWLFGHHHHNFMYKDSGTHLLFLGELRYVDVDAAGNVDDLAAF